MKKIKKTKIIATIGPSSSSSSIMEKMMIEGVDVFRINFSHAKHNEVKTIIKRIRDIDKKLSLNTAIIADLQGPKLRIGRMRKNSSFKIGDEITINCKSQLVGNSKKLYVSYDNLAKDINEGENILLDDGKIILKTLSTNKKNQIKKILNFVSQNEENYKNLRSYLIIELLYSTGIRVSELISIKINSIDLEKKNILIDPPEKGKSRTERIVFFGEQTKEVIEKYLEFRKIYFKRFIDRIKF